MTICQPMISIVNVAMPASARIGAVHSVVFNGFSPDSSIQDCASHFVSTADEAKRGGKRIR